MTGTAVQARPYAEVIGDPIIQSKSPAIHGYWIGELGLDADYRPAHVTAAELEQRIRVLEWDIRLLEEQRKPLYQERRNTNDEEAQAKYSTEIQQQTAALREKRGELRLCRRIQADIPRVSQQCQQAQAERQENLKKKIL